MISDVSPEDRIVKNIRCIVRGVPDRSPLPDLSIRQLEYLVAVAEEPSWALAAARVGVSASALSQGLAELERRIGLPLFERDGRRRRLRASAAPAVGHARQVLALTGDLAQWAERLRLGRTGRLRLGMIDVAAVGHHSEVLQSFRSEHPDVDLRLRVEPSAPLIDRLVSGDLDLVVCVEPPTTIPGIETEPLLDEELSVYGPPGARVDDPTSWGPWVLFPEGSHTRASVVDALARLGAPLEVAAESHQPDVLREMVRLGAGWTVLPTMQAEQGDRPLTDGRALMKRRLVLATRRDSVRDPVVDDVAARLRGRSGGAAD
jgi:DNA-binding transcriptional LysR family regulator